MTSVIFEGTDTVPVGTEALDCGSQWALVLPTRPGCRYLETFALIPDVNPVMLLSSVSVVLMWKKHFA